MDDIIVSVKNFGKITEAEIDLRDLTVFAGINNTGKSYISRVLYSILYSLASNAHEEYCNHILREYVEEVIEMRNSSKKITSGTEERVFIPRHSSKERRISRKIEEFLDFLDFDISPSSNYAISVDSEGDTLKKFKKIIDLKITEQHEELIKYINSINNDLSGSSEEKKNNKTLIKDLNKAFESLQKKAAVSEEEARNTGYIYIIRRCLLDNFQITRLSDLIGHDKNKPAVIEISFNSKDKISVSWEADVSDNLKIAYTGKDIRQEIIYEQILYFESPFYWKLKDPLEFRKYSTAARRNLSRTRLTKVPEYFYDTLALLREEWRLEDKDYQALRRLADEIKKTIGGQIEFNDNNQLVFVEEDKGGAGKAIDLLLTSTGVVQLGIIGLLIRQGGLDENTLIFMDEPEANLHTAWQEKMMDVILKLKSYGVKIVIATHSGTIMQKLELEVARNELENSTALNLFHSKGNVESTAAQDSNFDKMKKKIAQDMNEVPYQMFLEEETL